MELVHSIAVRDMALELRELQWEIFVDGAGISDDVQRDNLLVQEVRKAWEVDNPISRYLRIAESKIRENSPETCSTTNEKAS